jgi:hypothetical protein
MATGSILDEVATLGLVFVHEEASDPRVLGFGLAVGYLDFGRPPVLLLHQADEVTRRGRLLAIVLWPVLARLFLRLGLPGATAQPQVSLQAVLGVCPGYTSVEEGPYLVPLTGWLLQRKLRLERNWRLQRDLRLQRQWRLQRHLRLQ